MYGGGVGLGSWKVGYVKVPKQHLCMWRLCFVLFLPILRIIKLDNCTVLMTSSNMLSIINVTKSNLDIKRVHEWYTAMLFHCLCVNVVCVVCFLFPPSCMLLACVCVLRTKPGPSVLKGSFLTAVDIKETKLYLFCFPTWYIDYNLCLISLELTQIDYYSPQRIRPEHRPLWNYNLLFLHVYVY